MGSVKGRRGCRPARSAALAGEGAVGESLAAERDLLVGGQVVVPDQQPACLLVVAAHGKRLLGVEEQSSPVELRRQLLAAAGVRGPCRTKVLRARAQDVRRRLVRCRRRRHARRRRRTSPAARVRDALERERRALARAAPVGHEHAAEPPAEPVDDRRNRAPGRSREQRRESRAPLIERSRERKQGVALVLVEGCVIGLLIWFSLLVGVVCSGPRACG